MTVDIYTDGECRFGDRFAPAESGGTEISRHQRERKQPWCSTMTAVSSAVALSAMAGFMPNKPEHLDGSTHTRLLWFGWGNGSPVMSVWGLEVRSAQGWRGGSVV